MAKLFISYSHMDTDLRVELEKHLSVLRRQGVISSWSDRCIKPGDEIHNEIDAHLNAADIILLLVSVDFLASDYCYDIELSRAMQRHEEGTARVIPVILRPCDWHGAAFGSLMATPPDGKPVVDHTSHDQGFLEVAKAIRQVAGSGCLSTRTEEEVALGGTDHLRSAQRVARSSDLTVKRKFTDHDRHTFLFEAFELVGRFFETSLHELEAVNPHVTGEYLTLDSRHFEIRIFVDGQLRTRCGVSLDSQFGWENISFWSGGIGTLQGSEEFLSVDNDGFELFLKAMGMPGMARLQGDHLTRLTCDEAAEYYWKLVLEKLKW